jgi:RNA ligase (TIGR02306 family)
MENRKLASIQVIRSVKPIEGADNIEVVRINNWDVVAKKGEFIAGDQCVYFEIDSFLPIREEFEFLRKTSYKKMLDVEGFRLKTIRLRKQLSQGLALPYSILGDHGWTSYEGMDVTQKLGVLKYEAPIPAELAGKAKGGFPSFIPKTDEERIQNLTEKFEEWKIQGLYFYESEKLDGTSATFYINDGEFGICSRNWELQETEGNSFWRVAREMKLEEIMRNWHDIKYPWQNNHSIQGELIGEGIQGNPYKIKGQTIRFFNLYNIDRGVKEAFPSFKNYMDLSDLPTVPIIDIMFELPDTIDELLQHVDGKSLLNSQANREGSVFRSMDGKISFKVISNRFLLKSKD